MKLCQNNPQNVKKKFREQASQQKQKVILLTLQLKEKAECCIISSSQDYRFTLNKKELLGVHSEVTAKIRLTF